MQDHDALSAPDLTAGYPAERLERLFLALLAVSVIVFAVALYFSRAQYVLLVVAAATMLALAFFPKPAFWLFLASLSVYIPQQLTYTFSVHGFDILLAVVATGMVLDFLLNGRTQIRSALFDGPFVALIIATITSAVLAYDPSYSVVPLLRIIVIYLAFRATFKLGLEIGVRKIILFYIYLVTLQSLYNVAVFFVSGGGTRVFGPSGLGYETFSMTAFPMALAFMIWSENWRGKLKFGFICLVIGFGILATQSRAPLLAVVIATPVLIALAALKARRERTPGPLRTIKAVFVPVAILIVLFVVLRETFFAGSLGRYEQFLESFSRPQGTVAYRITQWTTAVKTFARNPFFGVGIGNFRIVHEIYPDLSVAPYFFIVKGMSAHNVFLHYLAETGLFGTLALLALAWKGFRISYQAFRLKLSALDNQVSAALFIAVLVFCVTLFYMRVWTWGQAGYIMSLIFGLAAAWVCEKRR
jgi:O-antigen ligase